MSEDSDKPDEPALEPTATEDESAVATSSHGASGGPIEPESAMALDSGRELWIPPDATEPETAAIAAAIAAYLADRERGRESDKANWSADRWAFAGRLEALGSDAERAPVDAPRDPWTASGRTDRF